MTAKFLEPKEFVYADHNGKTHTYILSKFPAWDGREYLTQYPLTGLPKIGDYAAHSELVARMMCHVGVPRKGTEPISIVTKELYNNHIPNAAIGLAIERDLFNYNFGFFLEEKALTFFERLMLMIDKKISEILTASLQPSSPTTKQPSLN